jgi:CO/xanthine dehydrogenase FAD-binding subunit
MRGYLPSFELRRARTLDEALTTLAHPSAAWRAFAGGTDLMVLLAAGLLTHQRFVSIWGIPELRAIDVEPGFVGIGALATFSDLQRHEVLRREFPLIGEAAREVGGVANQNRGTLGGNIVNASPAADAPPALLVYDAEIELTSVRGTRRVPYARFHTGYKQMDRAGDELVTSIRLPRPREPWMVEFRKVGARRAQAISKVCFAAAARVDDGRVIDIRLAFGSVAPTVVRAAATETALRGADLSRRTMDAALDLLAGELAPIDDIRSTARYRGLVAGNLLRRFLERLAAPPERTRAG